MTSGAFYLPEWTMTGFREGAEFVVLGSRSLSLAELRRAYDHVRGSVFPGVPAWEMSATMREVSMGRGGSYGEAMTDLMSHWDPAGDPERQVAQQPALSSCGGYPSGPKSVESMQPPPRGLPPGQRGEP